ncbi:unnamed protein product [Darwinula stevensoni]|uniref:Uncharacterized protein n=1 Tax=Darwinula stevensoni TaxID=69355 RepID=A0A7R8X705_9CRUS|nr:unnamed protein product [Darwinula stevensoni]CAG0881813.1 unnamed protein product [Darwinula stevensoni]
MKMMLLIILPFALIVNGQSYLLDLGQGKCEEITMSMCNGIGYNYTRLPNIFNHETQVEAGLEVQQFLPLVTIQCSPDLQFFLCAMYMPICMEDYPQFVPPCRSVCLRAKIGCAPIMAQYGFSWPERMNCDNLPDFGQPDRLCMDYKNGSLPDTSATGRPADATRTLPPHCQGQNFMTPFCQDQLQANVYGTHQTKDTPKEECTCSCVEPYVPLKEMHPLYNHGIQVAGVDNCAVPCNGSAFFSAEELAFANLWISIWSILCCVSTFITVTTFCIDMQRFKYPERPTIFLSGCYFMVSVGYLIRVTVGSEAISCSQEAIRYNATGNVLCTVVFVLVYFFSMASSVWWVILALTWFLAAGLKWGNEAIAGYAHIFHLCAWLLPAAQTITVLAMSAVDGDPISGLCTVGNMSVDRLRIFVLGPLSAYLLLGTSFLLAGFVSLFRIRRVIRQQARQKADKLEKLMIRICIFSVLYTVPASVVVACIFYEQAHREEWFRSDLCSCRVGRETPSQPDFSLFMVKYFMSLAVGITSGFWVWSSKTLDSWRRCYGSLCGRRSPTQGHNVSNGRAPFKQNPQLQSAVYSHVATGSLQKHSPLTHV